MLKLVDTQLLSDVAIVLSGLGAAVTAILAYTTLRLQRKSLVLQEIVNGQLKELASKAGPRASGDNVEEVSDHIIDGGEF